MRSPSADAALLVLGVALAVAGGRAFSGWFAPRALPVVYATDHSDRTQTQDRLVTLWPTFSPPLPDDAFQRLRILTPDSGLPELAAESGQRKLVATIRDMAAALVILDCSAPVDLAGAVRDVGAACIQTLPQHLAARFPTGRVHRFGKLAGTEPADLSLQFVKPAGAFDLRVRLP